MHTGRGTTATIYLNHLKNNLAEIKRIHPGKVIAVVKADAYGHGLKRVVPVLEQADALAVATIEEAVQVRGLAKDKKIILLEGMFNPSELEAAFEYQLDCVIHHDFQLQLLRQFHEKKQNLDQSSINIWVKVNTGMNRLGFEAHELTDVLSVLEDMPFIKQRMLMSHFADSDCKEAKITQSQKHCNQQLMEKFSADFDGFSFSNTGAVFSGLSESEEWARIGIGLFGLKRYDHSCSAEINFQQVMQLSANVIAIHQVNKGESIGYSAAYVADKDITVAVVGIGYADGYPWHNELSGEVVIKGQHCAVLGRVSMDMMCVDVSALDEISIGQQVVLWGPEYPAMDLADSLNIIPYVLACGITNRVRFDYVG